MDIYSDNISGRRIISFNTGETLYSRLIHYLLLFSIDNYR